MNLLVVGSGGREHAIVDRLARDAPDARRVAAPGNPGIAEQATCVPIRATDVEGLVRFARDGAIGLVVVGPEAPLAAGLVDRLHAEGIPAFGPTAGAARIEASKAFAKDLMRDAGVPTAGYEVFREADPALAYLEAQPAPIVVKASGLAAGKGAIVCETRAAARQAVRDLMVERRFGDAGDEVVIEECLTGPEISVFFLCDGEEARPLVTSRDYKRAGEGDAGLNTGGMGAYAPAWPGDAEFVAGVQRLVAQPVLEALAERGSPYRGFLYAGLMLTESGPRVIEFNCRMGDPETQVVLPLLGTSLLEPMLAVARGGSLGDWTAEPVEASALVTVVTSAGYPGPYRKGLPITLPEVDGETVRLYHAGTALDDGRLVTAGGRVIGATAISPTLEEAAAASRAAAAGVRFDGATFRGDIGWHELEDSARGASRPPA